MGRLENEFSWSWTRHGVFQECKRRYWLQYYGSWGGWERDADERVRTLYIQKNLTTPAMWLGTCVHEGAEWALGELQRGRFPSEEQVARRVLGKARRDIADSREGAYIQAPKRRCGFAGHYYGESGFEDGWDETLSEMERQVGNLFTNPIYARITHVPDRIREVEKFHRFPYRGVPVWAVMDVLMADGRGGLVIIDWKTGKSHDPEGVKRQLGVYGIYAEQVLKVGPASLRTVHVDLRENEFHTHEVTREHLDETGELLVESAAEMRALTSGANVAEEESFPKLEEGHWRCRRCNFRRDCGRE